MKVIDKIAKLINESKIYEAKELLKENGVITVDSFFNKLNSEYIEKPKSVWDLKKGDAYYSIDMWGNILKEHHELTIDDDAIISQGNAFLTREEAEEERKRREVYNTVKKYAYEFTKEEWYDVNLPKYYAFYNFKRNKLMNIYDYSFKSKELYFKSETDIYKAIEEVGEADFIRYYLGVK